MMEGNVEARKKDEKHETLNMGQFFGEMSVIDQRFCFADVLAVEMSLVSRSPAGALQDLN